MARRTLRNAGLVASGCRNSQDARWAEKRSLLRTKVGKGLVFISLNVGVATDRLRAETERALDKLRAELESKGVDIEEGCRWYRLLVVRDPDGNELYFNYPNGEASAAEEAQ
jgi:hypothetical protein